MSVENPRRLRFGNHSNDSDLVDLYAADGSVAARGYLEVMAVPSRKGILSAVVFTAEYTNSSKDREGGKK